MTDTRTEVEIRPVRSSVVLAPAPLPLCRISVRVEHGQHHDNFVLDREVDGVREAPEQRPTDSQPEILIPERTSAIRL